MKKTGLGLGLGEVGVPNVPMGPPTPHGWEFGGPIGLSGSNQSPDSFRMGPHWCSRGAGSTWWATPDTPARVLRPNQAPFLCVGVPDWEYSSQLKEYLTYGHFGLTYVGAECPTFRHGPAPVNPAQKESGWIYEIVKWNCT